MIDSKSIQKITTPVDSVNDLVELADTHLTNGYYNHALAELDRVVSLLPDWFLPYFSRGLAYSKMGRSSQAVQEFNQAIRLNPLEPNLYFHRAESAKKQNAESALADYDKALELDPDHAPAYLQRAKLHEAARRFLEALADYSNCLLRAPDEKAALEALPRVQQSLLEQYNERIKSDPQNAALYAERGMVLRTFGNEREAAADLARSVELAPNNAQYWGNLGILKSELGDFDHAVAHFTRAIALDESLTIYAASRAVALLALGKPAEAIADLDVALGAEPDNANYQYFHAKSVRAVGKLDAAADELRKLTTRVQDNPRFFDEYGSVLLETGETRAASEAFGNAFKLAPSKQRAFRCGVSLAMNRDYGDALSFFDLILDSDPYNATAATERGAVLAALDRDQEAATAYQQALQSNPEYYPAWLQRAALECRNANFSKALSDINQAIKLAPENKQPYQIRALIYRATNNPLKAQEDEKQFNA